MVKTMGLYEAASTKIKVRFSYSEEFPARVGVQQGSVLSSFLFATVIDVITEKGLFHEILYAHNLVFMSDSIKNIQRKFANWITSLEIKGLKINKRKRN